MKGAGAAQEGDTGRGRAERFHGTSFLKERRGHGRGIPFYEGGNRRGRKAGGRAKGAPLSSGEAGGGKGGAARKHCIFMEGSPFRCRCPSRGGPMRGVAVYTRILAKDLAEACPHWEAVPGGGPCLRGAVRGPHSGICVDVGGCKRGKEELLR